MIRLAQDTIDREDLKYLAEWLQTNPQLTKGPLTELFESKIAKKFGINHAVMVNSGSSANMLMIHGLMCQQKIKRGDKVVIPALCWATDLAPVIQLGLTPVICDINLRNLAIDPTSFEEICKKESPKVLLLVSVLGMPPDLEEIEFICRKYNVILLLDNCESLGSKVSEHPIESFGYASTMSMYFGHHFSSIEGGIVFTNDPEFAEILKMTRAHGWDRDLSEERKEYYRKTFRVEDFDSKYAFYFPGFNFRPTEINAFLALRQQEKIDEFVKTRKQNFEYYQYFLKNKEWKPVIPEENFVSNLGYPIITSKREKVIQAMEKANIECRPLISGDISQHPVYLKEFAPIELVNAKMIHKFGMYVPNHPYLGKEEIYDICQLINSKIG